MKRLGLLLACVLLAASAWAGEARIRAVDAVGITVSDMDRTTRAAAPTVASRHHGPRGPAVLRRYAETEQEIEPC